MKRSKTIQFYDLNDNMYLIGSFGAYFCSKEALEILESIQKPEIDIQNNQLLKIFPQAKSVIKRLLKEYYSQMNDITALEDHIKTTCFNKIENILEREQTELFLLELEVNIPRKKLQEKIKNFENLLKWSDFNPKNNSKGMLDIPKAKSYPISDLLEFNRSGFTKCIWHNEKTPSLKYYSKQNKVHCFSCNKSADSIDTVMQLKGCSLKEAVMFLNK